MQRVSLISDHNGMTRVVSALIAHDVRMFASKQVDDFCLALVTPLSTNYNCDGHVTLLDVGNVSKA